MARSAWGSPSASANRPGHRALLGIVLAMLLGTLWGLASGCKASATDPRVVEIEPKPPTEVEDLDDVLVAAGLQWIVHARPREIAATPWLIPAIAKIAPEQRLAAFQRQTGLDLRQLPEAIVAAYGRGEPTHFYLVRHTASPMLIERAFRQRLTRDIRRSVDAHDVIRLSGKAGTQHLALVLIGSSVAGFQVGGDPEKGPARIAAVRAGGALHKVRSPFEMAELRQLRERFGKAPLIAVAPGPFEDEVGRAGRGLVGGATAVGLALRLTAREHVGISVVLLGDFSKAGMQAEETLLGAYRDVAESTFGELLALSEPLQGPLATHSSETVSVAFELDPNRVAQALERLTAGSLEDLLRPPSD